MPYWHSTHTRANVVGFLISSPRLLLIRKRVCAWVPTRPSVRFSRCCLSKSKPQQQLSKLLELWYQAGSHHWYGQRENALWFADARGWWCWNLHPFDFLSEKKLRTDSIWFYAEGLFFLFFSPLWTEKF